MLRRLFSVIAQVLSGVFAMHVNTVPGGANSIDTMDVANLRRVTWESKLRQDSIRPSVFTALKSAIKVGSDKVIKVLTKGIWMEITVAPEGAGQSCRVAMQKPLDEAPAYGNDQVLGNEDQSDLLYANLYYQEIKKAIKYKAWGYQHNDTRYLNYIQTYSGLVTEFMHELRDLHIHQATLMTVDESLTAAPVSQAQQFNKNCIVPNSLDSNFPDYDEEALTNTAGAEDANGYYSDRAFSGAGTFVENIAASIVAASGVGATPNNLLTVGTMAMIQEYVQSTLIMEPIMLDGIPTYVFVVPSRTWAWTVNPNNSGSLAEHFQKVSEYKDPDRIKIVGEIGRLYENFLLVKDMRAPTITISGGVGTYSIQPGYLYPGNYDGRNNSGWSNTSGSTNYVHDIGGIYGANALAEYMVDPMVTDLAESTNYGQDQGRAAYVGCGIQIPRFDLDSADQTATSQIQRNCAWVPFGRVAPAAIV